MPPKIEYFNVNWENGMKINKDHFVQQASSFNDSLKDLFAVFLNDKHFGLLPIDNKTGSSIKTVLKIDNHKFLKVNVLQCRAVSQGGARIEILEEHILPELQVNISRELESSNRADGEIYYVLLSVDIFNRQPFGELDSSEDPPRYPYTIPSYKVNIISENKIAKEGVHPYSFFIGKIELSNETPVIHEDYIPPCLTVNSHRKLMEFYTSTEKFFSQLELNLVNIIRKINEKNQDSKLAQSVFSLSDKLLQYVTNNHLKLRLEIPNQPPIFLFGYIATMARVIRNTIEINSSDRKEELLNYFTNWSELKQGDFEKLLVYCINFEYRHFEILVSIEQFTEFIQIIALLFDKLESLAYIGKKKETNIFVKEQKTKRSFLAD